MNCVKPAVPIDGMPDTCSIELSNRLCGPESATLECQIRKAVDSGMKNILLDCVALDLIDSASLTALVAGLKYLKAKQGNKLVCVGANATVARVLTLTKIDKFIPLVPTRDAAQALLRGA